MAAENIDRVPADAHARSWNLAGINGVAHGGVRRARALGAHVAFSRETGHKVGARGKCRSDGPLRYGFFNRLKIFGSGMQEEMHVSVYQTGEKSPIAKINDFERRTGARPSPRLL